MSTTTLVRGNRCFVPRPDGRFAVLDVAYVTISPDGTLSVPSALLPHFPEYDGRREDDTFFFPWHDQHNVLRNLCLGPKELCRVKVHKPSDENPMFLPEQGVEGEYWLHDWQDMIEH